jgi:hypothetical protein
MITRFALLSGRLLVAFAFLFTVTACGGGGGGGGSFVPDQDGDDELFLSISLVDADGNETNSVATGAPTTLRVKAAKKGNNKGIANVVVTAETTAGKISPASGTALTNGSGIATFRIQVDADTKGAGTITASADNENGAATSTFGFQVGNNSLRLGYIDENGLFIENQIGIQPDSPIGSKAVAQLSVVVADEKDNIVNSAESVSFSSGCIVSGQAVLDPANPVMSGDGRISTSYRAAGCFGNDAITASLEGSSGQAFGTVTVASSQANGLNFVSAVPTVIVLRNTAGISSGNGSESSIVTFRVEDQNIFPLPGIEVNFSLTSETGGLSLSPETAVSGSDGLVRVNVFSGDTPTRVRVIATATAGDGSGQSVSTVSDILSVSTGLPSQDTINLSVEGGGLVIEEGFTTDGISRTLNLSMLDNFGNPVPDGTSAAFRTEYGAIDPSCQTVDGKCSVTWTSASPRLPLLTGDTYLRQVDGSGYSCSGYTTSKGPCPSDLGYTRGGRSTVLVTATGEESFIDRNDNGIMDEDEKDLFTNLSEAFLDKNEDGIFNPATATCQGAGADSPQCIAGQEETLVDFNNNGRFDKNNPPVYNGLQCPPEGDGVWCSRKLVDVRSSTVLTLSQPSQWFMSLFSGTTSVSTGEDGGLYTVAVSDIYNNRPPKGYSVRIRGTGSCDFLQANFEIQDSAQIGAFLSDEFAVSGEGTESSKLNVTLLSDTGAEVFSQPFTCKPSLPPVDPNDPDGDLAIGAG